MEASRECSRTPRRLPPCSDVSVLLKTRTSHFWAGSAAARQRSKGVALPASSDIGRTPPAAARQPMPQGRRLTSPRTVNVGAESAPDGGAAACANAPVVKQKVPVVGEGGGEGRPHGRGGGKARNV